VNLTERGLPTGTGWWANLTGGPSVFSNSSTASFSLTGGSYRFSASATNKTYQASGGEFIVGGPASSEIVVFSPVTYPVAFQELGLSARTNWSVTLAGSTLASASTTILFPEPNGTYPFSIGFTAGWTPSLRAGVAKVSGGGFSESILWAPVTYPVRFAETGLVGSGWSVQVAGGPSGHSTGSSFALDLPNGSYTFSAWADNRTYASAGGSFVVDAVPFVQEVTFSILTYVVTFVEGGLPPGSEWSATLGGQSNLSTGNSMAFTASNGSYRFRVGNLSGYELTPASGIIYVVGGDVWLTINFTSLLPAGYPVTFWESGLPNGTAWSISMDGATQSGTGELTFPGVLNGTYAFVVRPVAGYSASPGSGSVTVDGFGGSASVAFASVASSTGSTVFPSMEVDAVLGGVAAVVAVGAVLLAFQGAPEESRPDPRPESGGDLIDDEPLAPAPPAPPPIEQVSPPFWGPGPGNGGRKD
jgi:hypothetical protein